MKAVIQARERGYAKLNLSLDVLKKRADGYHEMRMVMQSCTLCDDLSITLSEGSGIRAKSSFRYLPEDERNLACRAAAEFFAETGIQSLHCEIEIRKRIPVCAGLGGGSADAAAVLRGLNRVLGTGLSGETLEKIGERVGSDVPYCVRGGTVLATGRGEILQSLPTLPDCQFVICKPQFSVSTPTLFSRIDAVKTRCHPDTDGILKALEQQDLRGVSQRLFNVFEASLGRPERTVQDIKSRLLDLGALGVTMSGTGSAVFGLFEKALTAQSAARALSREYKSVYLAKTQARSI